MSDSSYYMDSVMTTLVIDKNGQIPGYDALLFFWPNNTISNKSFLHLILLYLFEIILNFILMIILKCLPNEYCLFENLTVTNVVAFIAITFYFGFCFLLFYEMKNFAVNLTCCAS